MRVARPAAHRPLVRRTPLHSLVPRYQPHLTSMRSSPPQNRRKPYPAAQLPSPLPSAAFAALQPTTRCARAGIPSAARTVAAAVTAAGSARCPSLGSSPPGRAAPPFPTPPPAPPSTSSPTHHAPRHPPPPAAANATASSNPSACCCPCGLRLACHVGFLEHRATGFRASAQIRHPDLHSSRGHNVPQGFQPSYDARGRHCFPVASHPQSRGYTCPLWSGEGPGRPPLPVAATLPGSPLHAARWLAHP